MPILKKILISRTDSIGDVILTLPLAGMIKKLAPDSKITFLGKGYTKSIIESSNNIDAFLDWDKLSKLTEQQRVNELKSLGFDCIIHALPNKQIAKAAFNAKIRNRIGVNRRYYHWLYCNIKPSFSRKNSDLHEAQLNLNLLEPLYKFSLPPCSEIPSLYGFSAKAHLPKKLLEMLKGKRNVILHQKSQGSAQEWGVKNFEKLAEILIDKGYQVIITGTEKEGEIIKSEQSKKDIPWVDTTGQLSLNELITLINHCDVLVAASTGPLHIAAALGKNAIGLYSPKRPIHPGRWAPIGKNAGVITSNSDEDLINTISPNLVVDRVLAQLKK